MEALVFGVLVVSFFGVAFFLVGAFAFGFAFAATFFFGGAFFAAGFLFVDLLEATLAFFFFAGMAMSGVVRLV